MQSEVLLHWLRQLTEPDTEKVKQATKQLQSLSLTNDFLLQLFHILRSEQNDQIRILASVLLRRKLSKSSETITKDVHEALKHLLLEQIQIEANQRIRKSLFELIGTIAKQDLQHEVVEKKKKGKKPNKTETTGWKEYLHLCGTLVQSTDLKQLELGMHLFGTLATYCGRFVLEHWPHTFNLITSMLKTRPSPTVCEQALIILVNLVKEIHQKQYMQTIIDLVPIANEAIQYLFVNLTAENTTNLLDFYEALLDCEVPNVIGTHLQSIISTCLQIALRNDSSVLESVRYNALSILAEICRQKKKTLLKHQEILPPIIQALLQIISSAAVDPNTIEDDDDDEPVVVAGANHVLEAMSYHLSPEKFVPLVISQVEPMLKSSVANERKAAYYVLSGIIDGCCDYINNNYLEPYMTALKLGLRDVNSDVSSAALLALGETCAVLEGEISKYSVEILPILMEIMVQPDNMQNHNLKVIRIYYAVEELIGVLNDEHKGVIPEVLRVLFHVHASTTNTKIRELVLAVYPAIAIMMKDKFAPYLEPVITQISPNLSQKPNTETLPVFCTSLHTLASLCRAVGTDHCKAILLQALEFSLNLYTEIDEPEFRSAIFALGGAASRVLKNEFSAAHVSKIMGYIFESLRSLDWIEDATATENRKLEWVDDEEIDGASNGINDEPEGKAEKDDDDDDDDDDDERMTFENAHVEEKAAATEALGDLVENCIVSAWPYRKDIIEYIKNMLEFPNVLCSQNAVTAAGNLLISIHKMVSQTQLPNEKQLIQDESDRLIADLIPNLCTIINTTASRSLAQIALDTIKSILEEFKVDMLKHMALFEKIAHSVQKVLAYKTKCQQESDEDNEENGGGEGRDQDGRDDAEYDAMLITTGGDLLPVLTSIACAGNVQFFPGYLASVIPKLQKRLRHQASVSDRSFVIGVLAETVQNMNEALLAPYLQSLFTMFHQYLIDDDDEVRTNSCFGMGVLCALANQHLIGQYETILTRLSHVLVKETHPRMIDNICSCLCRMIVVSPQHVPLEQVLPVLFQHLPLREDFAEAISVFTCLNLLYEQHFTQIESYLPKCIEMAASIIDDERVLPEAVPVIREFLRSIYAKHSVAFVQVMQTLNEPLRVIVTKHLQTN
ncbi:unnamed protein product [Rotaria socialis]|uniref:Importin N-terminal domain-containing protein n=1 Tax=Rotaria socialis TaxID=392032 RepID=A0A817P696_9BILA|nr:unnamed protein product [Rotaria socialis]CAF3640273.1 unnamed protein product [Rotaria socialis]CAF4306322.1 unnamed protein product [Rotaria socialis]